MRLDAKRVSTFIAPVVLFAGRFITGYKANANRIGACNEYDRYCCADASYRACGRGTPADGNDERNTRANEVSGECRQSIKHAIGKPVFHLKISAFDVAACCQSLAECR